MGRIVDVEQAIEALPAERAPPTPVTIAVADSLVDRNDGAVTIATGADGPSVRSDADVDDADVSVSVDVGLLSQLYVGAVDVETLQRRGDLDVDENTATALAALFPSRAVYLPDFF
jgi:predicted acetyltransferase